MANDSAADVAPPAVPIPARIVPHVSSTPALRAIPSVDVLSGSGSG